MPKAEHKPRAKADAKTNARSKKLSCTTVAHSTQYTVQKKHSTQYTAHSTQYTARIRPVALVCRTGDLEEELCGVDEVVAAQDVAEGQQHQHLTGTRRVRYRGKGSTSA
jgi:hypothetical protein